MREFMIRQIAARTTKMTSTSSTAMPTPADGEPQNVGGSRHHRLVPAFVLSELKVAFLMGFRIYLPFLIIDMVISSVLISIGMQLLPPVMVSLPFKLLLFVLVDGWHLVCGTLLASFELMNAIGPMAQDPKITCMLTVDQAIDLLTQAMMMTLIIIGPILVIGMVIGLVISLVQAVTQIQEQTLAFVPKIFAMGIAVMFVMPWMFQRLIEYTRHLFMMH